MFSLAGEICFYSSYNMSNTEKIGLHHLVTIPSECINASVRGVVFQLVRILISTGGKIVSEYNNLYLD